MQGNALMLQSATTVASLGMKFVQCFLKIEYSDFN